MQITDTITERFETFGRTAVENVAETNAKIVDTLVEWNQKAVDVTVRAADSAADRIETPFAVPFVDQLPTAGEAGKRYMEVVNRAADANRDARERVVEFLPVAYRPAAATTTKTTKTAKKAAASK